MSVINKLLVMAVNQFAIQRGPVGVANDIAFSCGVLSPFLIVVKRKQQFQY